jgi:hypothetical protein
MQQPFDFGELRVHFQVLHEPFGRVAGADQRAVPEFAGGHATAFSKEPAHAADLLATASAERAHAVILARGCVGMPDEVDHWSFHDPTDLVARRTVPHSDRGSRGRTQVDHIRQRVSHIPRSFMNLPPRLNTGLAGKKSIKPASPQA